MNTCVRALPNIIAEELEAKSLSKDATKQSLSAGTKPIIVSPTYLKIMWNLSSIIVRKVKYFLTKITVYWYRINIINNSRPFIARLAGFASGAYYSSFHAENARCAYIHARYYNCPL